MSDRKNRPKEVPIELGVELVSAEGLVAADSNGFSDPYAVIQGRPDYSSWKKVKSYAYEKTTVIKKSLNPVWNKNLTSRARYWPTLMIAVYDQDPVGTDDFLGWASLRPEEAFNARPDKTQPQIIHKVNLLPRQGKKDKVTGSLTFRIWEELDDKNLSSGLKTYYAKKLLEIIGMNGQWEAEMLVEKLHSAYMSISSGKPINKVSVGTVLRALSPDVEKKLLENPDVVKFWDDNGDGMMDFYEVMSFLMGIMRIGKAGPAIGALRMATTVALNAILVNGKIDHNALKALLIGMTPNSDQRDQDALQALADSSATRITTDLDADKDGTITLEEIRVYCIESPSFISILKQLNEVKRK